MDTIMDNMDATLKPAVEQAADAVMITDLSGVIQYVNAAFERVSGYARGEVIGRQARLLKSGKHEAAFYRSLWTTLCHGQVWSGTFVNRRKDGRLYEDQTVISPVRNEAGSVVSYLAVKRDVTFERQKEIQLRQMQRLEAIGRLAGGVAHDFNNFLMTIMGHTEMLEARLPQTGGPREEIAQIKGACDRAASLTRQLLAFGRRQARELVVVDVNRVVLGLEKMLRRLLGEDIRLTIVPSPRPAVVRFEFAQIEQLIMTLAVRAREAMPTGGVFTIAVCDPESPQPNGDSASSPPEIAGWIAVRVADTGLGLDADAQAHVFEPFYASRLQPWETGLGLATAHEMVRQSGGRLSVRSVAGEGTTFAIHLPSVAPDDASVTTTAREPRLRSVSETILLAEDEDVVRELVRAGLTRLGYRVLDAPDGATALERAALHGGPIDLLITDVVMPGMSARELADRLLAVHPTAKVIYMSGYPDEAIGDQGVWRRGAVFLQKPFTPEALARTVREVFEAG